MRTLLPLLAFLLLTVSPLWAQEPEEKVEAHIRFLADDLTEGRSLGSKGLDIAALYFESQFRRLGLKPPFDGSYRQPFTLVGSKPDPEARLEFQSAGGSILKGDYGNNFVLFSYRQDAEPVISGELVYAGYLIDAPERQWDDLKGVDLKDKVLLVEVNEPENRPGGRFDGTAMTIYGRWTYKYDKAAELGAKGILLVHNTKRAAYGWDVVRNSWTIEGFFLPELSRNSPFEGWVSEDVARKVVAAGGKDYDKLLARAETTAFKPVPLGVEVVAEQRPTFRKATGANVAGMLPGVNPNRTPVVVVTAHYDHNGTDGKGGIYNGVVDNTSACAALLLMAEEMSEGDPLPVNVLFAAVTAEEQGLWGSTYLANNPPVDASRIWADINLEMTNIWTPTEDVYGIGASQSSLDNACREAAENLNLEYIPEQDKENGFFFRSDQFPFAKAGIPSVWLHEGLKAQGKPADFMREALRDYRSKRYHKVSDELAHWEPIWDLSATVQMARWAEEVVKVVANSKRRPRYREDSAFGK